MSSENKRSHRAQANNELQSYLESATPQHDISSEHVPSIYGDDSPLSDEQKQWVYKFTQELKGRDSEALALRTEEDYRLFEEYLEMYYGEVDSLDEY